MSGLCFRDVRVSRAVGSRPRTPCRAAFSSIGSCSRRSSAQACKGGRLQHCGSGNPRSCPVVCKRTKTHRGLGHEESWRIEITQLLTKSVLRWRWCWWRGGDDALIRTDVVKGSLRARRRREVERDVGQRDAGVNREGTIGQSIDLSRSVGKEPRRKTDRPGSRCVLGARRVRPEARRKRKRAPIGRVPLSCDRNFLRESYEKFSKSGLGDWIRTSDPSVPNRVLYQAEPRPDNLPKPIRSAPGPTGPAYDDRAGVGASSGNSSRYFSASCAVMSGCSGVIEI